MQTFPVVCPRRSNSSHSASRPLHSKNSSKDLYNHNNYLHERPICPLKNTPSLDEDTRASFREWPTLCKQTYHLCNAYKDCTKDNVWLSLKIATSTSAPSAVSKIPPHVPLDMAESCCVDPNILPAVRDLPGVKHWSTPPVLSPARSTGIPGNLRNRSITVSCVPDEEAVLRWGNQSSQ